MTTQQTKLDKLKMQREKLDKQIRAEAAKASAATRKLKARQKYIVGGIVLAAMNENNALAGQLLALIKAKASADDLELLADALPQQQTVQQTLQTQSSKDAVFDAVKNKFGSART
ncbi:MAG: hypothetical protein GX025_11015 [Clostridiales bacterium]|nr:hypothetical protein [Clostridiales bacterium]